MSELLGSLKNNTIIQFWVWIFEDILNKILGFAAVCSQSIDYREWMDFCLAQEVCPEQIQEF